jgi:hypothetical protein
MMTAAAMHELVQQRIQASERVRDVMAAAIIRAVKLREGLELSWVHALRLAESGNSIGDVLERIREQKKISRVIPGGRPDKELQAQLTLFEVVADLTGTDNGDPSTRMEMIEQLIAHHDASRRAADALDSDHRELETLLKELEETGFRQREFVRNASRLRGEQIARLREEISNAEDFTAAVQRLDGVYSRYLQLAMSFSATRD